MFKEKCDLRVKFDILIITVQVGGPKPFEVSGFQVQNIISINLA